MEEQRQPRFQDGASWAVLGPRLRFDSAAATAFRILARRVEPPLPTTSERIRQVITARMRRTTNPFGDSFKLCATASALSFFYR